MNKYYFRFKNGKRLNLVKFFRFGLIVSFLLGILSNLIK